jgi:glycogen(starch) synthase
MRITIWPSAYAPSLGGVEELSAKLAKHYNLCGHDCDIIVNRWPKNLPREARVDDILVHRMTFRLPENNMKVFLLFLAIGWIDILQLFAKCLRDGSDLHHVICCSSNLPFALMIARLLRKPIVVTAQGEIGMDASGLYQSRSFVPRNLRKFITQASWITACSAHTCQELLEYSGTTRCAVVHNGIDLSEFHVTHENPRLAAGRPYVFAMGRHVQQKGFDVLIRAWHQLQLHDFDLVIGGSGTDTEYLQELIRELKLEGSVHLIGRLDRTEVVSHLQHASCFVLPSRHEPFGIVVLEAMAARTPVIATAVGGVPEFVTDGVNGRLVPGNDVDAMAQAIQELIVNGANETQISAGHATAVEHDWSSIATEYLNIYSKCIAGEVQV